MKEAELVFTEILGISRLGLYLESKKRLDKNIALRVSQILRRRIRGEPLPYILGKTEFFGMEFKINPSAFIPRPETEILIEETIQIIKEQNLERPKILDIGTGSGCIAISLAKFFSQAEILALDISGSSLSLAKENARLNKVKIKFLKSDLFEGLKNTEKFDIIVSNPPYIPRNRLSELHPELRFEPRISLDGGKDGLYFYRRIFRDSPRYIKDNGFLILEIGIDQIPKIKKIIKKQKRLSLVRITKDYHGLDRVITLKKYG
ncbi:MAG: peptide chain release factor N(5)-glutamine methyltransferase [Candidatus Omnitrophica bacterium]|nr:peptide chain release factor N(5)-glutamine methyltransferase [Candidatus Omnitrophota bacterium]